MPHLFDERRCKCGHDRSEHSSDGDSCWSNEPLGICECPGFRECAHEQTVVVERAGGDVRGTGYDAITERCLDCAELISE